MKIPEEKKEFALSQLAPYLADPSTCGFNKDNATCEYLTPEGKMCVAGKNMIEPKFGIYKDIIDVLFENEEQQDGIFKPEVVGILTNQEWKHLQSIHDTIAVSPENIDRLKERITKLNLFTYEELVERAEKLKNNLVV
jgi:hypothetical protein